MSTAVDPPTGEDATVAALRRGDPGMFREVVAGYHPSLMRMARSFVPSDAVAEEVVQETWIAVIRGIDRFEQRSSLRTWVTRILINIARARGVKERRTVPMASLAGDSGPTVDPDRFTGPAGHGMWRDPPAHWSDLPEVVAQSGETFELVVRTVRALPEQQKWVVMLRDVEDRSSADVCDLLGITEGNQRVLLHRGRATVRAALASRLEGSA